MVLLTAQKYSYNKYYEMIATFLREHFSIAQK